MILTGDCLKTLKTLRAESHDACFCDPPYGLSFMGKAWDHGVPGAEVWAEVLRVLKPGAPLLAFGGTRTFHRLACAIEDGGFILSDTLCWLHGQGFPKGHAQLKPAWEPITLAWKKGPRVLAIDAARIGTTEDCARVPAIVRETASPFGKGVAMGGAGHSLGRWPANVILDSESAAALDAQSGITKSGGYPPAGGQRTKQACFGNTTERGEQLFGASEGGASRFFYCAKASRSERNAGLDSIEIVSVECDLWEPGDRKVLLQVDTGQSPPKVTAVCGTHKSTVSEWNTFLFGRGPKAQSLQASRCITATRTSSTTQSRILNWLTASLTSECTAGASLKTVNGSSRAGNVDYSTLLVSITFGSMASLPGVGLVASKTQLKISGNAGSPGSHPTVKPVKLTEYLARLILPANPKAKLLVPFSGSGSEMLGAKRAGWKHITGIEREPEYVKIAERRMDAARNVEQAEPRTKGRNAFTKKVA